MKQQVQSYLLTAIIVILLLFIIGKCSNKKTQVEKPTYKIVYKDTIIKVPVFIKGKTEYKTVFKTKDSLVYVDNYLTLDSVKIDTVISNTVYQNATVKDTSIIRGTLLSHTQSLFTKDIIDTVYIPTLKVVQGKTDTVVKVTVKKPRPQLYLGLTAGNYNGLYINPSIGLRTKNGYFYSLYKDLICKDCGGLSINVPLRIRKND